MKIISLLLLTFCLLPKSSFAHRDDSYLIRQLEEITYNCEKNTSSWQDEALCYRESLNKIIQRDERLPPTYRLRCEGVNIFGKFARDGGCNSFGCYYPNGGCNIFGCWYQGGTCNAFGCVQESPKTKQACTE